MQILKTKDNFLFGDVTSKAKDIFNSGLFELYQLHYDESESLINDYNTLNELLEKGNFIYRVKKKIKVSPSKLRSTCTPFLF